MIVTFEENGNTRTEVVKAVRTARPIARYGDGIHQRIVPAGEEVWFVVLGNPMEPVSSRTEAIVAEACEKLNERVHDV